MHRICTHNDDGCKTQRANTIVIVSTDAPARKFLLDEPQPENSADGIESQHANLISAVATSSLASCVPTSTMAFTASRSMASTRLPACVFAVSNKKKFEGVRIPLMVGSGRQWSEAARQHSCAPCLWPWKAPALPGYNTPAWNGKNGDWAGEWLRLSEWTAQHSAMSRYAYWYASH